MAMKKSAFLTFFLFISLGSFALGDSEISITIDDFSIHDGPKGSIEERDELLLKALAKHKLQAALFVRCKSLEDPRIAKRLKLWDQAGHIIANHTYSHDNYHKTDFKTFSRDILHCDRQLRPYTHYKKLFRFPMLKGGDTPAKHEQIQNFLKAQGYKNGYVTIDASDWYISDRLEQRLKSKPQAPTDPYKYYYRDHMLERAQYYEELAAKYWKKPVKHTILIHHNLLNSLFLDDLIETFKENKWQFVDAKVAFQDPIFEALPKTIPAGESLLWAMAKQAGDTTLRHPGEDSAYERKKMDELGL